MAWVESHQSLATHRKTLAAAAQLKISRLLLIGHLHMLWWWALDNVPPDGRLNGIPPTVLEQAAAWTRRPGAFMEALELAGFITDGRLHNWEKYGGKLQSRRQDEAERKRRQRADIRRTSEGLPQDVAPTAHVEKSREDKRRVEKRIPPLEGPPLTAPLTRRALPINEKFLEEMKHIRREPIDEEFLEEMQGQFPRIDVRREHERREDWKRERGKRFKDDRAGLRNWLRRAEDFKAQEVSDGSGQRISAEEEAERERRHQEWLRAMAEG